MRPRENALPRIEPDSAYCSGLICSLRILKERKRRHVLKDALLGGTSRIHFIDPIQHRNMFIPDPVKPFQVLYRLFDHFQAQFHLLLGGTGF
jgi:hypothetical protein